MNNDILDLVLRKPMNESAQIRSQLKNREIERQLKIAYDEGFSYYAETNHMFIKTYHDVVMQYFTKSQSNNHNNQNIYVIILRRLLNETVVSQFNMMWLYGSRAEIDRRKIEGYYDISEFQYDNEKLNHGMLDALTTPAYEKFIQYTALDGRRADSLIAYNYDIEFKTQHFIDVWKNHKKVTIIESYLDDLETKEGALKLLKQLNIEPKNIRLFDKFKFGLAINDRASIYSSGSHIPSRAISEQRVNYRILKLFEFYKKQKIRIPNHVPRYMPAPEEHLQDFEAYQQKLAARRKQFEEILPLKGAKFTWEEKQAWLERGVVPERYKHLEISPPPKLILE
eukprot:TRINITY_DN2843_c1_g1_i1.p1 TRINITY_DN2843_c1_g1~~TRINITY_DN2843_c1_g1_i1.p1  ORF type:complete len:339 (-),score=142.08 TRINITY_DN2843_c1_g1_i1:58-1074(-)